jgi:hypothetical protein
LFFKNKKFTTVLNILAMKTRALLSIILLLSVYTVNAQLDKTKLGGYFENQLLIQEYDNTATISDYNKLLIDLNTKWSDNLSFNADFILKSYHGKTEYNLFDFIPSNVTEAYAAQMGSEVDSLKPLFGFNYENEFSLNNAYVSFYSKHFNLRVGKQQLPWGSGYGWNPTDLFNSKNLLDPTYEKPGVNAIKTEIPFHDEGMMTAVFSPSDDFEQSTYAFKVKEHVSGFDLSASYVVRNYSFTDYYSFQEMNANQQMLGFDFSGSLAGIGLHGELAYNFIESEESYGQYLFGADYTFENGLFLQAEYYYNGKGSNSISDYSINGWMQMLGENGENMGQNYLYSGQSLPVGDYLTCSNFIIINFDDKSGLIMPWFDVLVGDNITITATGFIPIGENDSEFGGYGYGGMLRLKAFF